MSRTLVISNRQARRAVNRTALRRLVGLLLDDFMESDACILGIQLVGEQEMTLINETFLGHAGSTDVITFDHNESRDIRKLHGELYICMDDAVKQAREFRTTWQSELARYVIHGLLHLRGYDDLRAQDRRAMKAEESRVLRGIARRFSLSTLARRADPR